MKDEINSASYKPTSDTVDTGTTGEDIGTGVTVKTRQFQSELLQQRNQQSRSQTLLQRGKECLANIVQPHTMG